MGKNCLADSDCCGAYDSSNNIICLNGTCDTDPATDTYCCNTVTDGIGCTPIPSWADANTYCTSAGGSITSSHQDLAACWAVCVPHCVGIGGTCTDDGDCCGLFECNDDGVCEDNTVPDYREYCCNIAGDSGLIEGCSPIPSGTPAPTNEYCFTRLGYYYPNQSECLDNCSPNCLGIGALCPGAADCCDGLECNMWGVCSVPVPPVIQYCCPFDRTDPDACTPLSVAQAGTCGDAGGTLYPDQDTCRDECVPVVPPPPINQYCCPFDSTGPDSCYHITDIVGIVGCHAGLGQVWDTQDICRDNCEPPPVIEYCCPADRSDPNACEPISGPETESCEGDGDMLWGNQGACWLACLPPPPPVACFHSEHPQCGGFCGAGKVCGAVTIPTFPGVPHIEICACVPDLSGLF